MRVLLVEDDPTLAGGITEFLRGQGDEACHEADGLAADRRLQDEDFDFVLVDVGLPGLGGYEVVRRIRSRGQRLPVILITARDALDDRIYGLDLGADDYLVKPFGIRELVARIRAILRRADPVAGGDAIGPSSEPAMASISRGRLFMDPARHHIAWDGKSVSLTVTEFLILEALAIRPGVIKSRNQLMDAAYPDDVFVDDRTVDSHIKRMRRKFKVVDPSFDAIDTLYGAGYSFTDD
jgi:two-component system response regulator ChvI